MRRFRLRFSADAIADLERVTTVLLERAPELAADAEAVVLAARGTLRRLPFVGRPARGVEPPDASLRELVVPLGGSGYLVLYRVGPGALVSVLAVRHQRERSYR